MVSVLSTIRKAIQQAQESKAKMHRINNSEKKINVVSNVHSTRFVESQKNA